jgi:hypothetical protein
MEVVTIKDTKAITAQDMLKANAQQETGDTDSSWSSAIDHDSHFLRLLIYQLECIIQATQDSSGGRILFGMKDRDISCPRKVVGHRKTARRSNAAEANATKGWSKRNAYIDNLLHVLSVQANGKGIHSGKGFEEDAGIFEHWQRCHWTNITEAKG